MLQSNYSALFEQHLAASQWPNGYPTLYEPCAYLMAIGGKRVRPISMLMAYHAFKDDYQRIMNAALAVEVFHNFTLMHDDIMDQATLRRNQPTVHVKYNTNVAILSGDVMLIHAYHLLHTCCDKKTYGPVLKTFTEVARGVCEGQRLDMDFETTNRVPLKTYIKMIGLKTAVLLAGSLQIGAQLAGAKKRDAQLMYQFGLDAGIAFQILDDYLDTFGEQAAVGKNIGGDIVQGKKTYLVLRTLELASAADKKRLNTLLANRTMPDAEKITQVKAIFERYDIPRLTQEAAANYSAKAAAALAAISAPSERKAPLQELLQALLGRSY